MRHDLRSFLILALPISVLAACSGDRDSASPVDTSIDLTGVASFCEDPEILADIAAIFPTGQRLRHVATVNCGQIFSDDSKGKEAEAIEKAFAFFFKTLEQNEADLLQNPAPSTEAKIVDLFTAIFSQIGFDLPEIDPQVLIDGEYAIGTLFPDGSLLTVSKHAGIADPHGALSGPVQVFIVKIEAAEGGEIGPSSVEHPCPAGVDNTFDCYPLFYDYTVSPESNIDSGIGLQVGQCNVAPVGEEPEILLLTPEGFLPEDDAPTGIDCLDVVTEPEISMTGWRSYAWAVLEPVSPLFRVTPAFAGKTPIGGRISNFSPVAPADPNSGLTETSTELSPPDVDMFVGFGEGDTQTFDASVTDLETEFGVSEGTVTFTVTGVEFEETFVADVVEGSAFMDVGCGLDSGYGDLRVPTGEFTVDADYSGTENYAPSSDPEASTLSCSEIVVD